MTQKIKIFQLKVIKHEVKYNCEHQTKECFLSESKLCCYDCEFLKIKEKV